MLTEIEVLKSHPARLSSDRALRLSMDVAGWLRSPQAQADGGTQRGGVYGCADHGSGPRYVYGEITGYYLTYLSWLAANGSGPEELRPRVCSAAAWMRRNWVAATDPCTRNYLDGNDARDWRNQYHFSFDLAMMLRGVIAARGWMEPALLEDLVDGLNGHLVRFLTPAGGLLPCVMKRGGARGGSWAVRPGAYQLKTAACILAADHWAIPRLRRAAENLLCQWTERQTEASAWSQPHPFFYSLEGLLLMGDLQQDHGLIRLAESEYADAVTARGFQEAARAVCARADVLAQALRTGCLLRALNCLDGVEWDELLDDLAARLVGFVGTDGAVCFHRRPDGVLESANTWCAMFASQALHFYGWLRRGRLSVAVAFQHLV